MCLNACPVTRCWWHRLEQGFLLWHGWRDSLYPWFSLAKHTVVFTAQPMASPHQKSLLVLVRFSAGWDGLFYISRTEYNYWKNKARGQICLMFCVLTDEVFGEVACSMFPFQLPSLQCQLPHSDPIKRWCVCAVKTCSPVEMLGTKRLQLHMVTQPEEENVVLTAWPATVMEKCLDRDLLFTDVTVTASDIPVLWVLN